MVYSGFMLQTVFAAAAGTGAVKEDPSIPVVVFTGIALVFAILVILWLLLTLEGKLFQKLDEKKQEKAKAAIKPVAPPAPAPVATPAPVPVVEEGIPPEVVAAIAAAVASIEGGKYTLRTVQTTQKGRGQWGLAGVIQSTEPF